jgi:hypothetical protein
VTAGQLAFTYAPVMQTLFQTRPVPLFEGLMIVAGGVALLIVLEVEKALLRRLGVFAELSDERIATALRR